jgi:hypothetical protein
MWRELVISSLRPHCAVAAFGYGCNLATFYAPTDNVRGNDDADLGNET